MKGRAVKVFIILGIVIFALLISKNIVANTLVSGGVKAITGQTLRIKKLDVGVFKSVIGITGLELHNPPEYEDRVMISMPEIYVDYNLKSLLSGKVHLEEVRLHLEEFTVVKAEDGKLNLDALKAVQASKDKQKKEVEKKADEKGMPDIQIDAVALKVGRVVYKDYSKGLPTKVQQFHVNIDEKYQNVTNPYALTSLIITRALMNTTVAKLTGFDVAALQGQMGEQITKAKAIAAEGMTQAADAAKNVTETATGLGKDALGSATESLEGATNSIKKLLPFGEKK